MAREFQPGRITLPEPPSANRWWRKFRGRMVLSAAARKYKADLATRRCVLGIADVPTGPVRVTLDWYRGRKSGDLDKRIGIALDAMQGVFFENDSQVVELVARRFEDKSNPRLEVTVEAA
jgi:crossover junction endodeoxyribonuclease RusA